MVVLLRVTTSCRGHVRAGGCLIALNFCAGPPPHRQSCVRRQMFHFGGWGRRAARSLRIGSHFVFGAGTSSSTDLGPGDVATAQSI